MRLRIVGTDTVRVLANQLSPEAREVLLWAWRDRSEPLRIGDLQRAQAELGAGRHGKIVQAREHAALLESAASPHAPTAQASVPETRAAQAPARQEPELRV